MRGYRKRHERGHAQGDKEAQNRDACRDQLTKTKDRDNIKRRNEKRDRKAERRNVCSHQAGITI